MIYILFLSALGIIDFSSFNFCSRTILHSDPYSITLVWARGLPYGWNSAFSLLHPNKLRMVYGFTFFKELFLKNVTETICDPKNLKYVLSGSLKKKFVKPSLQYLVALQIG